jgi:hypothetical protein
VVVRVADQNKIDASNAEHGGRLIRQNGLHIRQTELSCLAGQLRELVFVDFDSHYPALGPHISRETKSEISIAGTQIRDSLSAIDLQGSNDLTGLLPAVAIAVRASEQRQNYRDVKAEPCDTAGSVLPHHFNIVGRG